MRRSEQAESVLFEVRPTRLALRDAKVGSLFSSEQEKARVIRMLRLLKHWPPLPGSELSDSLDFEFENIEHRGQSFVELKISESWLTHKELRVFLWPDIERRVVWILHAFWKKTNRIPDEVKTRVAKRLRMLKGDLQDGDASRFAARMRDQDARDG